MGTKRVLLAGAGSAGRMALEQIRLHPEAGLQPIGFLDDDPALAGKQVEGLPVLDRLDAPLEGAAAHAIDEGLIAIPPARGARLRPILTLCARARVASR